MAERSRSAEHPSAGARPLCVAVVGATGAVGEGGDTSGPTPDDPFPFPGAIGTEAIGRRNGAKLRRRSQLAETASKRLADRPGRRSEVWGRPRW